VIASSQITYNFLSFGDTVSNNRGSASVIDEDGSVFYTGTISNGVGESDDILFCKIDADGNIIWSFNYGSVKNEYVNNMIRYDEDYFIICGDATDPSNGNVNGFLLKVNASGAQDWLVEYGFVETNEDFYGLTKMSNGEIAVTGFRTADTGTGNDVLVVRYDLSGTVLQKIFFGEDVNDYGMGIVEGADNSLFISGDRISTGSAYNAFIAKIDEEGNILWDHMNGFGFNNGCKTIMKNSAGNIMLVGESAIEVSPVFNIMVSEIDTAGNFLWTNWIGESGGEAGYDISEPAPGNYFISGFGYNYETLNNDIIVVQIDGSGNEISRKYYGETGVDYAYDIKSDIDGNYWVSGFTKNGDNILFALIYGQFDLLEDAIQNQNPNISIELFPNPVSGWLHCISEIEINSVEIIDMQGRMIKNININSFEFEMELPADLSKGIYLVKMIGENTISTKKIIVNPVNQIHD
jgi:hypothetical protein